MTGKAGKERTRLELKGGPQERDVWHLIHPDMSKKGILNSFVNEIRYGLAKDRHTVTSYDDFMALSIAIRDRIVEQWIDTQQRYHKENVKRVYYLSMEFLIGRLLGSNIINLGLWRETEEALQEIGHDLEALRDEEHDAGLGNGGLGRLAACFLDSMATLGIPAHGYGIRYDYGIFNQRIVNGCQVEAPDEWLKFGNPWEFQRPETAVKVCFYGDVLMLREDDGTLKVRWQNTQDVIAMPYDIPVPGYRNGVVNTLRLWSARSSEEFDLRYFNEGDYERAVYDKMFSESISKVLYPNDSTREGRELRLKQEYFFTAASIADIVRRFRSENSDFRTFPDKVAIQLNDTHPALSVAELMRVLIDEKHLEWDLAWEVTSKTFAYTNHTVMPEALETWSVPLFEKLLPRHLHIIYEINARFLREVSNRYPGDETKLQRMSLIKEGEPKRIRLAHLAIAGSHSVNGVSKLHSSLIREGLFRDFYELWPEKFNNKTNGITHRRWLAKANRRLTDLITSVLGTEWIGDLKTLEKLLAYKDDKTFQNKWAKVKRYNKERLSALIQNETGVFCDPDSLFDIQVKRIHEYKRQTLFVLYAVAQYLKLKESPSQFKVSRTLIFSGKAAPGYTMAKLMIKLVCNVASVVNQDQAAKGRLCIVFLPNYRVSLAERIFPATDLSEQISTAGTEASGTGCMKAMMNGALTVGTRDGANIEMAEEAGEENLFVFGRTIDEIRTLRLDGYDPNRSIEDSPALARILEMVEHNFFSPLEPGIFQPLVDSLRKQDSFFVCADFDSYCRIQDVVSENYLDQSDWIRKSIHNVAKSGKFSSDRVIAEYARDIWGVPLSKHPRKKP
jgi:glycogen phosphorylase